MEAYLTVLNKDSHVSVVHSLVRLESELWPSNPVKGKVAAFVGEVRPGSATPNLVVFEGEAEMFSPAVFPRVKFESVVDYHEVQEKFLPVVAVMIDEDPSDNEETEEQVRHLVPIPTKWVPSL